MYLKKLTLVNIRSYLKTEIDFHEGITLLSGDIGSGKTTILMALEFALFGILRGKTSPGELLRHGSKEGSVILECEFENKHVIISRGLKRRGDSIIQLPGEIVVDGESENLVATELKARILNLLGYPETLLSKSTNLFRYTVYTPQEQVKQILLESEEERKDIIRKIFSIDKYKTVSENAQVYQNDIRLRIGLLEKSYDDLKTLQEQMKSQERELQTMDTQIPSFEKDYLLAKEKTEKLEKILFDLRKQQEDRIKTENSLVAVRSKIKIEENAISQIKKQLSLLDEELKSLKNELVDLDKNSLESPNDENTIFDLNPLLEQKILLGEQKTKLKTNLDKLRKNIAILNRKSGIIDDKLKSVMKDDIQSLTICPTCKQEVTDDHKKKILELQKEEKEKLLLQQKKIEEMFESFKEKETKFEERLSNIMDKEKDLILKEQQLRIIDDKKQRLKSLQSKIKTLESDLKVHIEKKQSEERNLQKMVELLETFPKVDLKEPEDNLKEQRLLEREKEKRLVELKAQKKFAVERKNLLQAEIKKKELTKEEVGKLEKIRTWLNDLFIPLINSIEKKVLFKVYKEFHTYFSSWFSMLIGTEDLIVRLDENFTPRITQQGFDTNIANLSGGEKTAVALSYRLALNKVLNDYFGTLNTKGLLILDEPTDGFSSEQIDLLKEVLEQLNLRQLIIVSHEQRLEALANRIIRIRKNNHQSIVE